MKTSQVYPGIWRISLDWKENPGAETSEVYVINGNEKSVIVDVSKGSIVAPQALLDAVESTGARMDNIAVFLTHFHLDHSGNVGAFSDWGVPALGGPREIATPPGESPHKYFPDLTGIPLHTRDPCVLNYLNMVYPPHETLDRIALAEDGCIIEVDPWRFEVIHTPGHSLESCCLYERAHKILFTGDTVLGGFVPPVNTTTLDCRKVRAYLSSLERLRDLDVTLVLPGHRAPLTGNEGYRARIDRIYATHQGRVAKTEALLKEARRGLTAYELMEKYVTYQVEPERVSKYYMVSHVAMMLGYLEQLYDSGVAVRTLQGGVARYEYSRFGARANPTS